MSRAIPTMFLAVLLAACVQPPGAPAAAEPSIAVSSDLVSDVAGAIHGTVVDVSLNPVANASIDLIAPAGQDPPVLRAVSTDAGGAFRMPLVEPGYYRVRVAAAGFAAAAKLVTVVAAEVVRVEFMVDTVPTNQAYLLLLIEKGLINCGFSVVVWAPWCAASAVEPVFGPYRSEIKFVVPPGHQAVVVETDWDDKAQTMHNWFYFVENRTDDSDYSGDAVGRPVLRKEFFPGERISSSRAALRSEQPFAASDETAHLWAETFYDGSFHDELNNTLGPACAPGPAGYCTGVGLAIQIRYTQYLTAFMYDRPPSLTEYSAVPDA